MKAGFSLCLSYMLLRSRIGSDVLIRIVAPKVAGSSPVGHPLKSLIGKPETRLQGSCRSVSWRPFDTVEPSPRVLDAETICRGETWPGGSSGPAPLGARLYPSAQLVRTSSPEELSGARGSRRWRAGGPRRKFAPQHGKKDRPSAVLAVRGEADRRRYCLTYWLHDTGACDEGELGSAAAGGALDLGGDGPRHPALSRLRGAESRGPRAPAGC